MGAGRKGLGGEREPLLGGLPGGGGAGGGGGGGPDAAGHLGAWLGAGGGGEALGSSLRRAGSSVGRLSVCVSRQSPPGGRGGGEGVPPQPTSSLPPPLPSLHFRIFCIQPPQTPSLPWTALGFLPQPWSPGTEEAGG